MPIIQKLIAAYKLWHSYWPHVEKTLRYSVGVRTDTLFITVIENIFIASRKNPGQKLLYLKRASVSLDILKFLLKIMWEIEALNNKKYIALSEKLNEVGRMLGGWQKNNNSITGVVERRE